MYKCAGKEYWKVKAANHHRTFTSSNSKTTISGSLLFGILWQTKVVIGLYNLRWCTRRQNKKNIFILYITNNLMVYVFNYWTRLNTVPKITKAKTNFNELALLQPSSLLQWPQNSVGFLEPPHSSWNLHAFSASWCDFAVWHERVTILSNKFKKRSIKTFTNYKIHSNRLTIVSCNFDTNG